MTEKEILQRLQVALSDASTIVEDESIAFSVKVLERVINPFGLGDIPDPDGHAHVRADCGDSMEVFLKIRDKRIEEARFDTLGCGPTIACGSMTMELAQGSTLIEALKLKPERIVEALGGLPQSHAHCAELAVHALKKAIEDYMARAKEPWKKQYRTR